jgi:hypothetical protein
MQYNKMKKSLCTSIISIIFILLFAAWKCSDSLSLENKYGNTIEHKDIMINLHEDGEVLYYGPDYSFDKNIVIRLYKHSTAFRVASAELLLKPQKNNTVDLDGIQLFMKSIELQIAPISKVIRYGFDEARSNTYLICLLNDGEILLLVSNS